MYALYHSFPCSILHRTPLLSDVYLSSFVVSKLCWPLKGRKRRIALRIGHRGSGDFKLKIEQEIYIRFMFNVSVFLCSDSSWFNNPTCSFSCTVFPVIHYSPNNSLQNKACTYQVEVPIDDLINRMCLTQLLFLEY